MTSSGVNTISFEQTVYHRQDCVVLRLTLIDIDALAAYVDKILQTPAVWAR